MGQAVFWGSAAVPFAMACLLLWKTGAFEKFWFWTITYASTYATAVPFYAAPFIFWKQFIRLADSSAPFMLLALAGLFAVVIRKSSRDKAVFMAGFAIFSLLCVCPGFYFRSHYFIFLLPSLAVLAGSGLGELNNLPARYLWASRYRRFILITTVCLISTGYCLYGQRAYLFFNTPAKVCRLLYGANPFVEAPAIGDFIRVNTWPDDTIAVIGSEPEIHFYSDRRSATGYIYTYPMMESHKYAGIMQNEMAKEIEAAKPKIIVLVNVYSSWLFTKQSSMGILKWADSYLNNYYEAVGIIEILPTWETIYLWNEQAKHYKVAGEDWIAVFKRKEK